MPIRVDRPQDEVPGTPTGHDELERTAARDAEAYDPRSVPLEGSKHPVPEPTGCRRDERRNGDSQSDHGCDSHVRSISASCFWCASRGLRRALRLSRLPLFEGLGFRERRCLPSVRSQVAPRAEQRTGEVVVRPTSGHVTDVERAARWDALPTLAADAAAAVHDGAKGAADRAVLGSRVAASMVALVDGTARGAAERVPTSGLRREARTADGACARRGSPVVARHYRGRRPGARPSGSSLLA